MKPSRIRVKMCGMTRSEDIDYAIHLGVDAIGLIFYKGSKRHVTLTQARKLLHKIPVLVNVVAVLVNPEKHFVEELLNELPINTLQFHGNESPEFCHQFKIPYIKSIHPENGSHISDMAHEFSQAGAILLDTPSATSKGGTGLTFDWSIIPDDLAKPYILAGGLNEENVRDAINSSSPYAVDVCSGIESSPGIKNHQKMSRFINALWGIT
ncbi:MAG: phosphoribosylanthranilate isomerase [Legionella sp.]|nr:phosphoribosylanthranilate isomerase [Legionella sp.]